MEKVVSLSSSQGGDPIAEFDSGKLGEGHLFLRHLSILFFHGAFLADQSILHRLISRYIQSLHLS